MTDIRPAITPLEPGRPLIVAGPCSAESEEQVRSTAEQLAEAGISVFRAGIWKPRTKPGGFEGVGEKGLAWLRRVKETTGLPVATEVATPLHVRQAFDAGIDILWIGARTTTNPFAVDEIATCLAGLDREGRVGMLVKNPVNPDVELWDGAIQRVARAGIRRISAVHRGFSGFGDPLYRNTPHWATVNEFRLRYPGMQILCDPSHIGGRRDLIEPIAQTALDLGFDGLMIESHCNPDCALSDAAQQLTPQALAEVVGRLTYRTKRLDLSKLDLLRGQIDAIDSELIAALRRRMDVSRQIGLLKQAERMAVVQPERYNSLMAQRMAAGEALGLDSGFVKAVFLAIHNESVRWQMSSGRNPER